MQEQFKRSLLLQKGQVTLAELLKTQQQHPPEHLRLEIEPLARSGADKVNECPQQEQHSSTALLYTLDILACH